MSKFGFSSVALVVAALCFVGFTARPAAAVKEFKEAFQAKYVKPDSTDANDVKLAEAFNKATCGVCHTNPKNKKIRNEYGKELNKIITKADKSNTAKIQAAMDTVSKLKSSTGDTFGDKITAGKLPAAK